MQFKPKRDPWRGWPPVLDDWIALGRTPGEGLHCRTTQEASTWQVLDFPNWF
jgi:hypothetical protein